MEHFLFSHWLQSGQLSASQPLHFIFSEHRQQASPHLAIPNSLFTLHPPKISIYRFPAASIAHRREKVQGKRKLTNLLSKFVDFWRSGWDSNPRALAGYLISSQGRYDRFDTAAYGVRRSTGRPYYTVPRSKKQDENPQTYKGLLWLLCAGTDRAPCGARPTCTDQQKCSPGKGSFRWTEMIFRHRTGCTPGKITEVWREKSGPG